MIALLDVSLGRPLVCVNFTRHLFVCLELSVDGSLLRAQQSTLSSGAHIASQFCEFILNPASRVPSHQCADHVVVARR